MCTEYRCTECGCDVVLLADVPVLAEAKLCVTCHFLQFMVPDVMVRAAMRVRFNMLPLDD